MRRRAPKSDIAPQEDDDHRSRLQKVLAAAGLGSRRKCEELITEGRVEIDRRVVTKLGTRVDPANQEIRVDGEALPRPKRQYFLLNKPAGVVSTARDPAGRTRVIDLIGGEHRLFPVGRLDLHSEGLILVTNDGDLANLLMHPRYGVEKTYLVQVAGIPSRESIQRLERGVHLAEGHAHAKRVRVKKSHGQSAVLEIVLDEGRNREVRRLLARIGHKVLRLRRTAIGPLRLGNLGAGEYRPLRTDEVKSLHDSALATRNQRGSGENRKSKPPIPATADVRQRPPQRAPAPSPAEQHAASWSSDKPVHEEERSFHTGTIIGGEETLPFVKPRSEKPPVAVPKRPTVKPIIDVRRGIFPGRPSNDDVDDDFADDPPPPAQPAGRKPKSKPPASRLRTHGKPPPAKPPRGKRKGGRR